MPIRILIADDNAEIRAAMRGVLETAGEWEVVEAENGKQAVDMARECLPGLVVLDLVMPVKDGLAAAREIVDLLPGTPVLMHTLYSSPQVQIEAAKTGVRRVVPKSESFTLISAVREAIEFDGKVVPKPSRSLKKGETEAARRRAEDRIRELCSQIATAANDTLLDSKIVELQEALHKHIEDFRARLIEFPVIAERRDRDSAAGSENIMKRARVEEFKPRDGTPPGDAVNENSSPKPKASGDVY
jgi:DNA-binding NarL/FixJ family response regulator